MAPLNRKSEVETPWSLVSQRHLGRRGSTWRPDASSSVAAVALLRPLPASLPSAYQAQPVGERSLRHGSWERNVELLKQKIAVYAGLMDRLEAIMLKGEVSLEDEIAVQMLNLRLSLFASTDVLTKFNEFARRFSLVAADREVTGKERAQLMDVLGQLSTTIRHDLASQEDRRLEKRRFSEEDLKNLVMSNVNMLFGNTAPKRFLESSLTEARGLLSRLTRRGRTP